MKPIKRIALYFLSVVTGLCLVAVGHTIKTSRPQLPTEMRATEEYAVYSALLANAQNGTALIIQNRTESSYRYDGSVDEAKYIKDRLPSETSEETLNDFKQVDRWLDEFAPPSQLNHWATVYRIIRRSSNETSLGDHNAHKRHDGNPVWHFCLIFNKLVPRAGPDSRAA
jgi:hypothetical protein